MLQKTTQCCNLLNIKTQPSVIRRDIVYLWLSPNVVCCRFEVYNKNNKEKIIWKRTKISSKETHTEHDKIQIAQTSTLCVCIRQKGEIDDQQLCPNVSDFKQQRTYRYRHAHTIGLYSATANRDLTLRPPKTTTNQRTKDRVTGAFDYPFCEA